VAIFLQRKSIFMKQAWAVGFTILERSKWLIFDHYYNVIRPALNNRVEVSFTDTDSLNLCVGGMNRGEALDKLHMLMDYSNYDAEHPRFNTTRQNQLGYWKDELKGKVLREFVGLASKTYAMRVGGDDAGNAVSMQSKCKGVKKGYRKGIPFAEYKKCVINIDQVRVKQYRIQSRNHTITTVSQERLAFSSFDDKRYILPCGVHTLAYGSHLISAAAQSGRCPFC
jgi:hypothetical protein